MLNFSSLPFATALVRTLLAVFLVSLRLTGAAQVPSWQSARTVAMATSAATTNSSVVYATAVDAGGNVFLTGYFKNTVALGNTTLTSFGDYDVFIAKFNPASNQIVWAQQAGGPGEDYPAALAVSGTSIYVAGSFGNFQGSTASFGSTTLTNVGSGTIIPSDIFVAKLTDAGSTSSFVWAQRGGGPQYEYVTALAVSGTSVYVAGHFQDYTTTKTAAAVFGATTLTSAGYFDVFVAKLTDAGSTGDFVWAQRAGSTLNDYPAALAVRGTNVYVTGNFGATADFGATTLTNINNTPYTGGYDVFVTKLVDAGSTGSFAWAQRAGGMGDDIAAALAVSGTTLYVAGHFSGSTADFGATTLTNVGYIGQRPFDVFVTKLVDAGSTGSFVWAARAGGADNEKATALAVNGTSVYLAGEFNSPTAAFGATTLTNAGSYDIFVAKLTDANNAGYFEGAQRAGGTQYDYVNSLAVSGTSVYLGGSFVSPTAAFGTTALINPTSNNYLGYLAALTDPTITATAASRALASGQLFPNPARHMATLRLPAGTALAPLTLTAAQGRAVRHYPAPTGAEAILDLQGLPAGLYLLRGAGRAQRLVVE